MRYSLSTAFVAWALVIGLAPLALAEDGLQPPDGPIESRVIDAGAEPLVDFVYDWDEGQTGSATLELWVARTESLDTWVAEAYAPVPIRVTTSAEVQQVDPDGTVLIETRFDDISLLAPATDAATPAMLTDLRTLLDVVVREQYDAKGYIVAEEVIDPHEEADELHPARSVALETVKGRVLRLPPEPLGLGGTWEELQVTDDGSGATGSVTFVKSLDAIDDLGRLRVTATSDGDIPEQEVPAEQLSLDEPGVVRGRTTATQGGVVDLAGLYPAWSGTFETHVELDMPLGDGVTYVQSTAVGGRLIPAGWDDPTWPQLPPIDTSLLPPAATTDAGSSSGPPAAILDVTLHDPGAEPRRLLRYELQEGQVEHSVMTMRMGMRTLVEGAWTEWLGVPPIEMALTTTVLEAFDDGSFLIEAVYDDVHVPTDPGQLLPEAVEEMEAGMASLIGLRQTMHMDARGQVLESTTVVPPDASTDAPQPAQLDAMTQEMVDPLPEEPVGTGAVWEVARETSDAMGFPAHGSNTLELGEVLPDGRLHLLAELSLSAEPGPMTVQGMDFLDATIDRFSTEGTGDRIVDLALVSPVEGGAESLADYAFTIALGEMAETTEMQMSTEMETLLVSVEEG